MVTERASPVTVFFQVASVRISKTALIERASIGACPASTKIFSRRAVKFTPRCLQIVEIVVTAMVSPIRIDED